MEVLILRPPVILVKREFNLFDKPIPIPGELEYLNPCDFCLFLRHSIEYVFSPVVLRSW